MNVFFLDSRKKAEVVEAFLKDRRGRSAMDTSKYTCREIAIVATLYAFKNIGRESSDDVSNTGWIRERVSQRGFSAVVCSR
jgi:hypothetical protein